MKSEVQYLLSISKAFNNKLYLPDCQIDRLLYLAIKKEITALGGNWVGGKVSAFVFDFEAQLIIDKILFENVTNIKKSIQFFPTPQKVIDLMFEYVKFNKNDLVLEPSAGQGAIVENLIGKVGEIHYCEFEEINKSVIESKFGGHCSFVGSDFLKYNPTIKYDKIINE